MNIQDLPSFPPPPAPTVGLNYTMAAGYPAVNLDVALLTRGPVFARVNTSFPTELCNDEGFEIARGHHVIPRNTRIDVDVAENSVSFSRADQRCPRNDIRLFSRKWNWRRDLSTHARGHPSFPLAGTSRDYATNLPEVRKIDRGNATDTSDRIHLSGYARRGAAGRKRLDSGDIILDRDVQQPQRRGRRLSPRYQRYFNPRTRGGRVEFTSRTLAIYHADDSSAKNIPVREGGF